MAISALPILARRLGVSMEQLIGEDAKPAKRGPTPKLLQQMECIGQLPIIGPERPLHRGKSTPAPECLQKRGDSVFNYSITGLRNHPPRRNNINLGEGDFCSTAYSITCKK